MSTSTTNYNLKKPSADDFYNVNDQNENMNIIDTELKENADAIATHTADYIMHPGISATGGTSKDYTVTLDPVPLDIPEFFGITIIPHVINVASPTLNINGLGIIALKDQKGVSYAAGKLLAGKPYMFRKIGSDFLADSGGGGEYGDALAGDVRVGKTFGTEDGVKSGTYLAYGVGEEIPIEKLNVPPNYVSMPMKNYAGQTPTTQYSKDSVRYMYINNRTVTLRSSNYNLTNADTNATIATITTAGSVGYFCAVDPKHGFAFIDSGGSGMQISKRNANTNMAEIWKTNETIFSGLYDLVACVPDDGGVAGFEGSNANGFKYNGQGVRMWRVTQAYSADQSALALAAAPNGDIYVGTVKNVSGQHTHIIHKFSSATGSITSLTIGTVTSDTIIRMRFDAKNNRLIVVRSIAGVEVRNANMGLMYVYGGSYVSGGKNVEVDSDGNIYVFNSDNSGATAPGITKFTPTLAFLWRSTQGMTGPSIGALDIDSTPLKLFPDVFHGNQTYGTIRTKQTIPIKL